MVEMAVIECGVDYLTATALKGEGYEWFAARSSLLLDLERQRGNDFKPLTSEGYTGFKTGAVFAGSNGERMMIRLSSHMAHDHWQEIASHASNISRLDLQVTVRHTPEQKMLAERSEREALKFLTARNLPTNTRLIRDRRKGPTLYIGERVSDVFCRLYNKHTETRLEHYAGCWRYETEFKRKVANHLARQMLDISNQQAETMAQVRRSFARAGLARGWPAHTRQCSNIRHRGGTDSAKRLDWIRGQVRGNIGKLADAGLLAEAIEALGLNTLIDWKAKDSKEE